jgi:hypothetical protein
MVKPSHSWEDLVNEVYPGLLMEIRASGAAQYQEDEDGCHLYEVGGSASAVINVRFVYPDKTLMRFVTTATRSGKAPWKITMFNWHCGPNPYDHEDTHFRIDLQDPFGLHAHIRGVTQPRGGHLDPGLVDPDIRKIDAIEFVKMVARFRQTKKIPLELKGKAK